MAPTAATRGQAVVAGAGIVGICCALYLQRAGYAVTLVDPEEPASQTSRGNAGGFGVSEVMPLSVPGLWRRVPGWLFDPLGPLAVRWRHLPCLAPWLRRFLACGNSRQIGHASRALAQLMAGTYADYEPLLRAAGVAGSVHRHGALTVYRDRAVYLRDRLEWDTKRACGMVCEERDAEGVRALEPALSPQLRFGVFTPDWRHTDDPYRLASALAQLAQTDGAVVERARVRALASRDGRAVAVHLDDGRRLDFDCLVVAAGVWSRALVKHIDGLDVPLESERGYNTTLPEPGVSLTREVIFAERKFVATPMRMGLRIGGAAEFAGLRAAPDYRRSDALLRLAQDYLPGLRGNGGTRWMGHRPSTPDSLPVLGRSLRQHNVLYAFGHGHLGLTQAATSGRMIAALATAGPGVAAGQGAGPDLAPFDVRRFTRAGADRSAE